MYVWGFRFMRFNINILPSFSFFIKVSVAVSVISSLGEVVLPSVEGHISSKSSFSLFSFLSFLTALLLGVFIEQNVVLSVVLGFACTCLSNVKDLLGRCCLSSSLAGSRAARDFGFTGYGVFYIFL